MPVAAAIDRIVAAGSPLADALQQALAGDDTALDGYGAARRPIAQQVVKFADVLTRMATLQPGLRLLRNAVLRGLSRLPALRSRIARRLSGLVYR